MDRKYLLAIGTLVSLGAVIPAYVIWKHNQAQSGVAPIISL
jgi:hypothetical protein